VFKQSKLAAAVLAAVATTGAHAVNLAEDGTGQVLVFPYYNTNNNFVTNLNITNTTNLYKAVKVRFRESDESNDTLDFNIYMTPQDSWTATIRRNPANGRANIITSDETCTYPSKALLQAGVDFIDLYDAVTADDTSEGYIEVIEMGVIADGTGPAADGGLEAEIEENNGAEDGAVDNNDRSIPQGLLHDSDGMPADCSVVADGWAEGGFTRGPNITTTSGIAADTAGGNPTYVADTFNDGLVSPTGGLTGTTILINPSNGAAFVADPTIIDNYATFPQHYQSDDPNFYLLPSLASGDVLIGRVPAADGTVTDVTWNLFDADPGLVDDISPNPSRPSGQNPLPMAHVMAVTGLSNDYFVDTGANGATDWVVTMPMKKHGIWNSFGYTQTANVCDTDGDGVGDNAATWIECPYLDVVGGVAGADALAAADLTTANFDGDDVEFTFVYYDREEQAFTPQAGAPGFSPVIITQPIAARLTREVNVVSFNEAGGSTQAVLGTPAANVFSIDLEPGWIGGWLRMTFNGKYVLTTAAGVAPEPIDEISPGGNSSGGAAAAVNGVPAIGFAALRADLGPAAVGETIPHTRYR